MNQRTRVLMIGRHYWPHGSHDAAGYLVQLSTSLQRRGIHTEVVTPRFASAWSEQFMFRDVRVHRPVSAPRGDWSISRYIRNLTSWLRENAKSFDVLLVDSARAEMLAAAEAARSLGCRVIVHVCGWGQGSDVAWWQTSRVGRRCAVYAKTVDCLIAANADCHRQLIQQGFSDSRIKRAPTGITSASPYNDAGRSEAREALAVINADLRADDCRVMLCVGKMTKDSGMPQLSKAAYHLINRYPNLKIWLVGDGPERETLHQFLQSEGIRDYFAMPGSFADLNDVFAAADFYVQASATGLRYLLPKAIAAELPIISVDEDSTRAFFAGPASAKPTETSVENVQWYDGETPKSFRQAVRRVMDDWSGSAESATELRRGMLRTSSLDKTVDQYQDLFSEYSRRNSPAHRDSQGAYS